MDPKTKLDAAAPKWCLAQGHSEFACALAAKQCAGKAGDSLCMERALKAPRERAYDDRMFELANVCVKGKGRIGKGCEQIAQDCMAKIPGGSLQDQEICVERAMNH